jgi:peptide/nickel transport system substrate-binding protein
LINRVQIATYDPEVIKQAMSNKDLANTKVPGASYAFIAFTNAPPFDNKLAREALYHCVDREALAEKTLQGFAEPTYIFAGPHDGMDFYPKDPATGKPSIAAGKALNPYDYNPEKARAIVKQLGGLKFKMTTSMGKNFATAVQQIFAQCNIEAEVYTPQPAQYTAILQQGTYQAYLNNTAGVSDMRLFSKYITPDQPLDQQNQVNDPIITAAFNKSLGDSGKDLEEDFHTIFQQLNKNAVLLPVVAAKVYDFHTPCIRGLSYFGNATSLLHAWKSC